MPPVKKILFPTDLSDESLSVLNWATELARWQNAHLHVLHVIPASPLYQPEKLGLQNDLTELHTSMLEMLNAHVPDVLKKSRRYSTAVVMDYSVADRIVEYARQEGIDFLITGTHGRSSFPNPSILGGTTGKLLRKSTYPMLTCRLDEDHKSWKPPKHILAPIDFSGHSAETVRLAKAWAAHYGASLSLLFVVEERIMPVFNDTLVPSIYVMKLDEEQIKHAEQAMEKLFAETAGPDVLATFHLREGHPAHEILTYAESSDVDLIMMSSHGHHATSIFAIGSTTERVVRKAHCAVFINRPATLESEDES